MKFNVSKENLKACFKSEAVKLKPEQPLSERAAAVQEVIINSDFGGYTAAVAKLMSILSGETIVAQNSNENLIFLSVFIPTQCSNSHNYDLNVPVVIITETSEGLQGTETEIKNHLNPLQGRYATEEEIDSVVDQLTDEQIRKIAIVAIESDKVKFFEE